MITNAIDCSMLSEEDFGQDLARSFDALWQFRQGFERRTLGADDTSARDLTLSWEPIALPNFEVRNGSITSRQQDFFALFPFAEALREFLIGVEEYSAYEVLEDEDYDQFALFSGYTTCFHLVDSFLCLSGIYYVPNPVGDCEWKLFRRMTDPRVKGAPMYVLHPTPLIYNGHSLNFVVARRTRTNYWAIEKQNIRSVHVSRWKDFGKQLNAVLRAKGTNSIPRPIKQFFNLFESPLAYLGISEEGHDVPLSQLISFGCDDTRFKGIKQRARIPQLRNLAIYRNQTLDEVLRTVAVQLDTSITGPVTKLTPRHFATLGTGLIRWQNARLSTILEKARSILGKGSPAFINGVRSAILLSGLVELDHSKVVDSFIYDSMHISIRENIRHLFHNRRYIPSRLKSIGWNTGTAGRPQIHALALPIAIPDVLTPRNDWFRRSKQHPV